VDKSQVKLIVDAALDPLMRRLGLERWEVQVSYASEAVDDAGCLTRGECTRLVDYSSAHIRLNPEAFDEPDAVLRTLRHELFHIVLSPFDLYTSMVAEALTMPIVTAMLGRTREHACEQAVINLERMFAGLSTGE
jgi:hypothetical protein